MASNLSVVLGADISGLKKNIEEAKSLLEKYQGTIKDGKKLTAVTEGQVTAYSKVVKELQKVASGSQTTAQAEKTLVKLIKELLIQWANLSTTAKNGEFGKLLSKSLSLAEQHLKTLRTLMKLADELMKVFDSTEKRLSQTERQLIDETKQLLNQMRSFNTSTASIREIEEEFKRILNSSDNLRIKLKLTQAVLQGMSMRGMNNAPIFTQMTIQAGKYADAISDIARRTRVASSDTFKFDAMIGGLKGVAGAASIVTGAFSLLGTESEEVQKAMLKVQALMTIMQGLLAFSNAFNKDNAFMVWLSTLGKAKDELKAVNTAIDSSNVYVKANSGNVTANTTARGGLIAAAAGQTEMLKETSALLDNETIQLRTNSILQEINTKGLQRDELAIKAHQAAMNGDLDAYRRHTEAMFVLEELMHELITLRDNYNRLLVISTELETKLAALAKAVAEGNGRRASVLRTEILYLNEENAALLKMAASNGDYVGSMKKTSTATLTATKSIVGMIGKVMSAVATFASWVAIIGAVGYGLYELGKYIYHLTDAYKKQQEELKRLLREQEKAAAKLKKLNDEVKLIGTTVGTAIASYKALLKEYLALQNSGELNSWIAENKSAFEDLGLSVNNAADAYAVFVKNSAAVITALKAVAKAEAALTIYKELLLKYMEWQIKNNGKVRYRQYKAGDLFDDDKMKAAGLSNSDMKYVEGKGLFSGVKRVLTESGAAKLNKYEFNKGLDQLRQETRDWEAENERYADAFTLAIAEAEEAKKLIGSLLYRPSITGNGGSGKDSTTVKKIEYLKGSLADLEAQLSKLESDLKNGFIHLDAKEYKKQVDALKKQIADKKIELGLELQDPEGSIAYLDKLLSEKKNELDLAIDDDSRKQILKEIDELTGKKNAIELLLKPVIQAKDLSKFKKDLSKQVEIDFSVKRPVLLSENTDAEIKAIQSEDNLLTLLKELELNKLIADSYAEQAALIKARQLVGANLSAEELDFVTNYDALIKKVEELSKKYQDAAKDALKFADAAVLGNLKHDSIRGTVDALSTFNSGISSVYSSWKNLAKSWNDKDTFEKFTDAFGALIGTVQTAISIFDTINTVVRLFNDISKLSAVATASSAATEATATTAAGAEIMAVQAARVVSNEILAASNKELAATEVAAAYASIPFAGPALAAAAYAELAALWTVARFANGGIFKGSTTIGDFNLARVNDGEMILNGSQLAHLFNLLNSDGGYGVNELGKNKVVFEIKGQTLRGVLNNYDKKMKKI